MKNYKHILAMRDGVIIAADDYKNIAAIVNGKAYRTSDYRPIDEEGRQLRADNQYTIQQLLPEAREAYKQLQTAIPSASESEEDTRIAVFAEALQSSETIRCNQEKELEALKKELASLKASRPVEPKKHKCFELCLDMMRDGEHPYLYGPAGTGKSYLARQLADALNVSFEMVNGVNDSISQLIGYTDAQGCYVSTPFYRAWKDGGVFLFDEMDASSPDALIAINEALANGEMVFPDSAGGRIKRNSNTYIIGAGNTAGRGGDAEYTARFSLDVSTLNRFFLVRCNYDKEIEIQLAKGDSELVTFIHAYRKAVKAGGISALATYRNIARIIKLIGRGSEITEALHYGLTGALKADEVKLIAANISDNSKYASALAELANILNEEENNNNE